ncbi:COG1361 S-layer family protein [Candidatus Pyrohabitans sp.]
MKRLIPLLTALVLLSSASAQLGGGYALLISDLTLSPEEIHPGDNFTLSFTVRNVWEWFGSVEDAYVYLEGEYPFLEVSPTQPKRLRGLGFELPGWKGSGASVSYNMSVDPTAEAGEYTIKAVLTYTRYSDAIGTRGGRERFTEIHPITITVYGKPEVEVYVKSSTPAKPRPGDTFKLAVKAVNLGSDMARNLLIYPRDVPGLDVLWSSESIYLGDIPAKGSASAGITIEAEDALKPGEYSLPVRIAYQDRKLHWVSKNASLRISIYEEAEFEVKPVHSLVTTGESQQRVNFTVANTGTKPAEEIRLTLRANYPFTPVGNEYYIERLAPGEEAIAEFHVDVDSDASQQRYPVDVVIKWKEDDEERVKVKYSYVEVQRKEERLGYYIAALLGATILLAALIKLRKR